MFSSRFFFFKHTIYLKLVLQQQNIKYELISLCFITNLFGIFILVCVWCLHLLFISENIYDKWHANISGQYPKVEMKIAKKKKKKSGFLCWHEWSVAMPSIHLTTSHGKMKCIQMRWKCIHIKSKSDNHSSHCSQWNNRVMHFRRNWFANPGYMQELD